jgi:tRNA(fMet)-specific endonuclease VapC
VRAGRDPTAPHCAGAVLSLLLLDTTFLIDAERSADSVDDLIADDDDTAIAAITVAELLVGVRVATGKRRAARQGFVDAVASTIPIIAYDVRVAHAHAELLVAARRSGRPRGAHDLIIAATAVASGRTVVTADPTAFEGLPGVELLGHR